MPLATHKRATMRAGIEQGVVFAIAVAGEENRAARHGAGKEGTGLGQLGGMAQIEPAVIENRGIFALEHLAAGEGLAGHEKTAARSILDDPGHSLHIALHPCRSLYNKPCRWYVT